MIAIIAILAGMLLPALTASREKARDVSCRNKLKQIGYVWQMYVENYQDWIIPSIDSTWPDYYDRFSQAMLSQYNNILGSPLQWDCERKGKSESFTCPSDNRPIYALSPVDNQQNTFYAHYGPNYWLSGSVKADGTPQYMHKISSIVNPSDVIAYGELYGFPDFGHYKIQQWAEMSTRHGRPGNMSSYYTRLDQYRKGRTNIFFSDHHVGTMTGHEFIARDDKLNPGESWVALKCGFKF